LWNLLGLFLISKFRRKPLLQKGSLIIIGHTAGFACINIATIIQTSSFDQNGGMAVLYLLIVLLVLLAGYSIIYFLLELLITAHFAVKYARKRRREDSQITASTSEVAPPMTPETDVPVDEVEVVEVRPKIVYIRHYHRRISGSPSATKRCLLKFVGHVIASTMAFITIQAFTFVIYGEYPGVTLRPPQEKAVAELYMWLVALGSAALVLVINLVAANKKAKYWLTRETWWGDIIFDAFHK
ncbi:Alpha-centractin, partial [Perkinsus olseni]